MSTVCHHAAQTRQAQGARSGTLCPRVLLALLAAVFSSAGVGADGPAEQRRYVWLTAGEPSGSQTVRVFPGGRLEIRFAYNDRGRGPDTETTIDLDGNGLISSFRSRGVNYVKGAVDEHFAMESGQARWRSSVEKGETSIDRDAMYIPVNQPPEFRALLARALLSQPEREMALLPSGTARIAEAAKRKLQIGGEDRQATLYSISGLELGPTYVWLDENRDLIGYDLGWFAILEAGWVDHLAELRSAQQDALANHISSQAEQFGHQIEQPLALVNVRVLDVDAGRLTGLSNVLLRNGKIIAVQPAGSQVPDGFLSIDGNGMTLMPSLWDMHAHIRPSQYLHYIASGVLNVRDMANDPGYIDDARADIASGRAIGPDIHPMGFIDQRSPFSAPTGRLAESLEEALGFVRDYADEGYAGIKLYSSIDPAWTARLTAEARRNGLRTAGHIPSYMSPAQAIHDGYREITHINMILLQLIGDWSVDTRTPQRIIFPGVHGGSIDIEAKGTDTFIDLLVKENVSHDPTLAIFMGHYRSRPGSIKPYAIPYADHLPPTLRRSHIAGAGYNSGHEEAFAQTGEVVLDLIRRLHERGVQILPGTDAPLPGFLLVSELEYYSEAGIANADILRLATSGPAEYMGLRDSLGSVNVGALAHLILVNGDPTRDLSVLRDVRLVIKGEVLFKPREILQAQGIRPFQTPAEIPISGSAALPVAQ